VLRVDGADGTSLSLDLLSQGTREAVFVSLRMALAAAYARRGAVLPLILDDVLVNFDTRRARAAAEVLRDFSNAGHQILMFTCHHHIMSIFEAAGVDVRALPIRDGIDDCEPFDVEPVVEEVFEPELIEEPEEIVEEDFVEEEVEETDEEIEALDDEDEEETPEEAEHVEEDGPEAVEEAIEEEMPDEVQEPVSEQADAEWDDSELTLAEDDHGADEFAPERLAAALSDAFKQRWWEEDADDAAA
jgi:hypothetical protein